MITAYHGSNTEIPGSSPDCGRAGTDFGTGFYVTDTLTVIGEKRQSFETFKSNVCHLVKAYGELAFIKNVLCSNEVQKLYKKQWFPECLYLVAMVDYLSRKNDIPLYTGYNKLRTCKLTAPLYPSGIFMLYRLTNDISILKKSFDESIPEFKRFNIIENEVENIF